MPEDQAALARAIYQAGKGTRADKAAELFHVVLKDAAPENRARLLKEAALVCDDESSGEVPIEARIPQQQFDEMENKWNKLVSEYIDAQLVENLSEDDFYAKMIDIIDAPIWPGDLERCYALHRILNDKCIPYFHIDDAGLRMSDSDYREARARLRVQRQRLRSILRRSYEQKTIEASLILREVLLVDSEADRAVLLASLIQDLRRPLQDLEHLMALRGRV